MADVLPNGEYGWQTVALAYQEQSKDEILHDSTDMKKHWIKVLCNGMKKPTGRMEEAGNRIHRCMAIEKKILKNPFENDGLLVVRRQSHFGGGGDGGGTCPAG
jgi:hypothetical protein